MDLDESNTKAQFLLYNKVLYGKCPKIQLCPLLISKIIPPPTYNCPFYKTSARRGVLSTTGHSTNFVMYVSNIVQNQRDFWLKGMQRCLHN